MSSTIDTTGVRGVVVKVIDANQVQIKYMNPDKKMIIMRTIKTSHNMKLNEAINVYMKKIAPYTFISIKKIPNTLDLKLLSSGGGAWNITNLKMLKSTVTAFGNYTVLRCHYDLNSGTSADPGVGGFSFVANPTDMNQNAIKLSWDVYYPTGFKFARGGKFGGVGIGYGAASGGNHSTTGASNRIMWQEDGGIIDYLYLPSGVPQTNPGLQKDGFGIGLFKNDFAKALRTGYWNKIELGTKVNTFKNGVPQSDGETYVSVNGVKRTLVGINWSGSPELKISQINMGNFFGGPTPSPVEQFCYFKNFQVGEY